MMNEDGHDFRGVALHESLFKEVNLAHFKYWYYPQRQVHFFHRSGK